MHHTQLLMIPKRHGAATCSLAGHYLQENRIAGCVTETRKVVKSSMTSTVAAKISQVGTSSGKDVDHISSQVNG